VRSVTKILADSTDEIQRLAYAAANESAAFIALTVTVIS
jgi:hypothetical protein